MEKIGKVSTHICEKSCQKFVTINSTLRSKLLSFCQIYVIRQITEVVQQSLIPLASIY
jgi:hypothetical protein